MAADTPQILTILGSTREGRFGETVAGWFNQIAAAREDIEARPVDLRDYDLPFFDAARSPSSGVIAEEAREWADLVGGADGYVIITPEYNRGYPAVLKNALDHLYAEWNNKPVGFVSYGGSAGGSRSVEQLRLVAIELQMAPIREGVVIPMARANFNEQGQPTNAALNDRANSMLNQLAWWARTLKTARGNRQ
ncbi:MAG: NADPH-dependent FMN reductase [Vicinamibacterales bacterium]